MVFRLSDLFLDHRLLFGRRICQLSDFAGLWGGADRKGHVLARTGKSFLYACRRIYSGPVLKLPRAYVGMRVHHSIHDLAGLLEADGHCGLSFYCDRHRCFQSSGGM